VSAPVVLKFGSSVLGAPPGGHGPLASSSGLRAVLGEIRRQAASRPVIAVVSAFAGETDRLLGEASEAAARGADEAVAAWVATGEAAAVARLALELSLAGLPAAVAEPRRLLAIAGARLDGEPVRVSRDELGRLLERSRVILVPGFFGESLNGGPALLGRGGSDLSALRIAHEIDGGSCRLLKDVDGIYERDPAAASGGSPPRRYRELGWAAAIRVAGRLVQPKAIRFARDRRLTFEVGAVGGDGGTRVGPFPERFVDSPGEEVPCTSFAAFEVPV
jgi:homoserine dehydrogenase